MNPQCRCSPYLYALVQMQAATTLNVPLEHAERALYLLDGELLLGEDEVEPCNLLVLPEGEEVTLYAQSECQLVLIGGAPLDGPRRMNWNFVASDPELIEQARARWAAGIGRQCRGNVADRIAALRGPPCGQRRPRKDPRGLWRCSAADPWALA